MTNTLSPTTDPTQFETLARRRAMGETIDRRMVEKAAAESNRSVDDFDQLVMQFEHRNDLRKRLGRCEAIRAELNDLETANIDEKRAMDKALEEFHKRQQIRRQRIDEIVAATGAWHADQSQLFATAPAGMRNRHAVATKELEKLRVVVKATRAKVDQYRRFGHAGLAELEEELRQVEERIADATAQKQAAFDACINY